MTAEMTAVTSLRRGPALTPTSPGPPRARWPLVAVRLAHRRHDLGHAPLGADHLQPPLGHLLTAALRADGRVGGVRREERAGPGQPEAALAMLANDPRAGRKALDVGRAQVLFRHEHDRFDLLRPLRPAPCTITEGARARPRPRDRGAPATALAEGVADPAPREETRQNGPVIALREPTGPRPRHAREPPVGQADTGSPLTAEGHN